jgi:UDP-4-amino-4,6-dideoxy-N-acetyl-beta-L-altrosamine N-acetyltransferase
MFEFNGYILRSIEEKDLPMVLEWRNKESVRNNMYTDHVISFEEHRKWFSGLQGRKDQIHLICECSGLTIGVVNFVQINPAFQRAFWGFYLGGEQPPGRGVAMEYVALEFAFTELKLRKLCCEVIAFNEGVLKLHKKFGFQEEGLYRQHIIKQGKVEDVVSLALFASAWQEQKTKLHKICFRRIN